MSNKKICLISGGAGFIGSNLTKELVKKKYKVFVVDNLETGNIKNLKKVLKKIVFIKSNINNLNKKIKKIDFVFHLAASVSAQESLKNKKKYFINNVENSIKFFNLIKKFKIEKFIYAASASCYGNNNDIVDETSNIECLSPYAESKWRAEQILFNLSRLEKIPFLSLRLFNVYGPNFNLRSEYAGVIGKFIYNSIHNKKLIIYGNGRQTRSFVHVDDVSRAFLLAAKSRIKNEIFNVGTSSSISIDKLSNFFKNEKIYKLKKKGDIMHSKTSIRKIKKLLKFNPRTQLKANIQKLLNLYKYE